MLSSITPLGEAGRGHGFRSTAGAFVAGSVAGGATLGAVAAALAAAVGALHPPPRLVDGLAAAVCFLAAATDLGLFGPRIPMMRRQVNELWLDRYRGWVYGAGFGWQIGVGLATYIMTAAVLALVPLAAATGSPDWAFSTCLAFGALRGLTVLLGLRVHDGASLQRIHMTLERLRRPVQVAVGAALAATGLLAGAAQWPSESVAALGLLVLTAVAAALGVRRRSDPASGGLGSRR
jgi:hypothetical protein